MSDKYNMTDIFSHFILFITERFTSCFQLRNLFKYVFHLWSFQEECVNATQTFQMPESTRMSLHKLEKLDVGFCNKV